MDIEKKYEPELELSQKEIADMSAAIAHPGFQSVVKLGRWVVDQFVVEWINVSKPDEVIEAHRKAKVAAQFFQELIDRINLEVINYRAVAANENDKTSFDAGAGLDTGPAVDYLNNTTEDGEEPLF